MFCTNCGKEINDEAIICPHCGVATLNFKAVTEPQPQEPVQKKANVLAIVGFSLSLASFAFIFISGYLFMLAVLTALVLSIVGAVKAKSCNSGIGFATAGIAISVITIFVVLLMLMLAVAFAFALLPFMAFIYV